MNSTCTDARPPLLVPPPETANAPFSPWRRVLALAISGAFIAAAGILFVFDPHHSSIYPVCIFHRLTGLNCPGCGSLRGLNELLHGHLIAALHANALLMLTLPFVIWIAARFFVSQWRGQPTSGINFRPIWLWIWLGAMVVFTVLRNIPAFAWLSP